MRLILNDEYTEDRFAISIHEEWGSVYNNCISLASQTHTLSLMRQYWMMSKLVWKIKMCYVDYVKSWESIHCMQIWNSTTTPFMIKFCLRLQIFRPPVTRWVRGSVFRTKRGEMWLKRSRVCHPRNVHSQPHPRSSCIPRGPQCC